MRRNHRIESPYPKQGITLVKAIELITDIIHAHASARTPDSIKALTIGSEAINRIQRERAKGVIHPNDLLPGETKG